MHGGSRLARRGALARGEQAPGVAGNDARGWKAALVVAVACAALLGACAARPVAAATHEVRYYGDMDCPACHAAAAMLGSFAADHPGVHVEVHLLDLRNETQLAFLREAFETAGHAPGLGAILNRSGTTCTVYLDALTRDVLERWLAGEDVCRAPGATPWIAFLAGLAVGASACVLLLLGTVGSVLASATTRTRYAIISTGLVLGVLASYVGVAAMFTWFVGTLAFLDVVKWIVAGILLAVGTWQIIDARREKSIIFGTPAPVKAKMHALIEGKTGAGAFAVGAMFGLVKIPCFGGPFLAIVFGARDDPALFPIIILYFAGMIIPYVAILGAMGAGLASDRVNQLRLKHRAHLRVASGLVLVALVIFMALS